MTSESATQFEVTTNLQQRVLRVRLSGFFTEKQMRTVAGLTHQATEQFRGAKHMVIADMRGMKPLHPPVAQILGDAIGYGRRNGAVLCAHISDHTVQRLQAARLARENSPTDDVTVDVSSVEEAERVLDEARSRLDDGRYAHTIREPLAA
jgi:hypothetical protein